ncbi:MAG: hypothetical protein ACRDM1_14835 [Gaiellaceae bacterium]
MTAAADAPARVERSTLDRLLSAYPLVVTFLALLILVAWQTTKVVAPWVFLDELKWALLSRSIAHTGHAALRLHPAPWTSLYSYFLAPAWWLGATGPGYAAAKYLNAFVMTASLFPAYGLARLVVPRWPAYLAATATAAIPALAYSGELAPEPLAYFWSTLVLYLGARALLRPTRWTVSAALGSLVVAPFVRSQLIVLVAAGVLAVIVLALTSGRGRSTLRAWTLGERVGAAVLGIGAIIFLDVLAAHHSYQWFIGTHYWHRAFTYGLWAFGAFTIGLGVLPVLFALAWGLSGAGRDLRDRMLLGVLAGSVVAFGAYTAVKASYISTNFAIRVEERNLIYLSPIVFVATARWLVVRRPRPVPVVLAACAVGYLLQTTPYHAYEAYYSDAPGYSILQWLNQTWYWTNTDLHRLLFGVLIFGVLYAAAVWRAPRLRRPRLTAALTALTAAIGVAVVGWNLTGEIAAANGSAAPARFYRSLLPTPPDWVDRETGRARTMFIGQSLGDSSVFWSLEFWNQSIQDVWSVDASAPPPGPATTPNFLRTDGAVDPQLPIDWVLAQPAIRMIGTIREQAGGLNLYHVPHPIRIASFVSGITPDGWMQERSSFIRFAPRPLDGTVTVSLSRTASCGAIAPGRFTFRVSSLRIDPNGQPAAGKLQKIEHGVVRSTPCEQRTVTFRARAPFRIDASAAGLFKAGDGRELAAQVGYSFKPDPSSG